MWRWLRSFGGALGRLLRGQGPAPTDRGMLVGMYLDQTNKNRRARHRGFDHQQRRDGKFAQNRRRA